METLTDTDRGLGNSQRQKKRKGDGGRWERYQIYWPAVAGGDQHRGSSPTARRVFGGDDAREQRGSLNSWQAWGG